MKFLIVFVTATVCFSLVHSEFRSVGDELAGRIIHAESLKMRGMYLDSGFKFFVNLPPVAWVVTAFKELHDQYLQHWVLFYGVPRRDVFYADYTQWRVTKSDEDGWVVLESIRFSGHYIKQFHHNHHWTQLVKEPYPYNKHAFKWQIKCEGNSYEKCTLGKGDEYLVLESVDCTPENSQNRYTKYMPISRRIRPESALLRLVAPDPKQRFIVTHTLTNELSTTVEKTLTYTEGMTSTEQTTKQITASVTAEVSAAFKIVSAKLSTTLSKSWTHMSSKAFTKTTTIAYKIKIPPRTKLEVLQLVGSYGPFNIKTKEIKLKSTKL